MPTSLSIYIRVSKSEQQTHKLLMQDFLIMLKTCYAMFCFLFILTLTDSKVIPKAEWHHVFIFWGGLRKRDGTFEG